MVTRAGLLSKLKGHGESNLSDDKALAVIFLLVSLFALSLGIITVLIDGPSNILGWVTIFLGSLVATYWGAIVMKRQNDLTT